MAVLILYATIEGQTGKIAHFLAEQVAQAGETATLVDIGDPVAAVSFDGVTRVILAASVHERRHPQTFEVFLAAQKAVLASVPTLMLSVSLKAAFADGQDEARDYLREMEMRTGFVASESHLVAGAVRANAYDYFERHVLQHVLLAGQQLDLADGPHEFTDWDALVPIVQAFVA